VLLRLVALAAALVLLAPAVASAKGVVAMSSSERALLQEINQVRHAYGVGPLRLDTHLERAARAHTREMLASGEFEHGAFWARMVRYDVKGRLTGENLAWGTGPTGTAHRIVDAWLASPEHRANLLRRTFTRIGVSDLVGAFLGTPEAHVVTADFAG
jgi:uncharacterized protein YkwD